MSLCRLPDLLEFAGSCQRKHHEIEWFFRTTVDGRRDTTIGLRNELDDINTTDEEEKVATSGRATLYRNPDRIVDRNGVVGEVARRRPAEPSTGGLKSRRLKPALQLNHAAAGGDRHRLRAVTGT